MRFPIDAVFLDRELRVLRVADGPQAVATRVEARLQGRAGATCGPLRTRGRERRRQPRSRPSGGYGARSDFVARALAPPSPESLTTRLSRVPFFTVEGMIHVEMLFFFPSMRKLSVVSSRAPSRLAPAKSTALRSTLRMFGGPGRGNEEHPLTGVRLDDKGRLGDQRADDERARLAELARG